ncbi:hypothetical protein [Cereibacter sphaeroides]|uniref:hypothetical protein n=1 Tax=Cereibacter sphaeroides TaxID=1063 RepID=UPI001F2937BE|nr:hypothetical protein [Cereibacter sphaeroides]MCE6967034.1 hypothetical protein [Cereibacter sphaeroides]
MTYSFAIPLEFQAMWEAGKLIRRGALLINAHGGGIVAHLQETGALSAVQPLRSILSAITGATSMGSLLTGAVCIYQNEQIKHRIDAMQQTLGIMQGLQVATLAGSIASLGVSAAGTAIVCRRLELLRSEVQATQDSVQAFHEEWRANELQQLLERAANRVERVDSAVARIDGKTVLNEAEQVLHETFDAMHNRVRMIYARDAVSIEHLKLLLDGMAVAGGAQIKALFLLDDPMAVKDQAIWQFRKLASLTTAMPADVLAQRLGGTDESEKHARDFTVMLSEARNRVASLPSLVDQLDHRGISTRTYLEAAESQTEAPLMILPTEPKTS